MKLGCEENIYIRFSLVVCWALTKSTSICTFAYIYIYMYQCMHYRIQQSWTFFFFFAVSFFFFFYKRYSPLIKPSIVTRVIYVSYWERLRLSACCSKYGDKKISSFGALDGPDISRKIEQCEHFGWRLSTMSTPSIAYDGYGRMVPCSNPRRSLSSFIFAQVRIISWKNAARRL